MAIEVSYPNPFTGLQIEKAYAFAASTNFDHVAQRAQILYHVHPSKADADAGRPPLGSISIPVRPEEFGPLVMANFSAFIALAEAVDHHALTRPEFETGERVTELETETEA